MSKKDGTIQSGNDPAMNSYNDRLAKWWCLMVLNQSTQITLSHQRIHHDMSRSSKPRMAKSNKIRQKSDGSLARINDQGSRNNWKWINQKILRFLPLFRAVFLAMISNEVGESLWRNKPSSGMTWWQVVGVSQKNFISLNRCLWDSLEFLINFDRESSLLYLSFALRFMWLWLWLGYHK